MKIQFAIHKRDENGQPGVRWAFAPGVPKEEQREFYDEKEAAEIAILESLRLKKIDGEFKDYVIVPYDEQTNMLELVDDKDQKQAAADATLLAKSNADIRSAVSTMLAARQLYQIGSAELGNLLADVTIPVDDAKEGEAKERPPHPLTIEVMTQAASDQGQKPFSQVDVFEGMTHSILPWLKKRIEFNTQQDIVDRQKQAIENEKARMATLVPVGINWAASVDNWEHTGKLPREKALVLVGYAPAVQYLLDHATNACLAATDEKNPNRVFCVVRFADDPEVKPSENERLALVGRRAWAGCTRTQLTMNRMVAEHVEKQLVIAPDLLVVDDLNVVDPSGIVTSGSARRAGGPAPFKCAEAHKKLMAWGKLNHMSGLFGVPVHDERPINLNASEWERLRTHAIVRPVTVVKQAPDLQPGKLRIVVGRDAYQVDVDAVLLEPKSQIIIPK